MGQSLQENAFKIVPTSIIRDRFANGYPTRIYRDLRRDVHYSPFILTKIETRVETLV